MISLQLGMDQIKLLRDLVEDRMKAYKNHIAMAVESGEGLTHGPDKITGFAYAQKLTKDLRTQETLFAVLNGIVLKSEGWL